MIFWRWHPMYIDDVRDGFKPFILSTPPAYWRRPHPFPQDQRLLFFSKVRKFILKSYIVPNSTSYPVLGVVDYFAVPKGDDDIRPVFNGTTCGLNGVVWAPNFWLPRKPTLQLPICRHRSWGDVQ